MTPKQPNLLFIQAAHLKPQVLPMYGGPAITPHLSRLADNGVTFDNAYCNFPLCAPSRFSMLSGMLASKIGGIAPRTPGTDSVNAERLAINSTIHS